MESFEKTLEILFNELNSWYEALISNLPNIVMAILVLAVGFFASRFIKSWMHRLFSRTVSNPTMVLVMTNIATFIFMAIVIFLVLGILNLDQALTSLLAGAGVAGLALGLALQDPLINMSSGILMSMRDYYKVGDLVKTNDYFGKIQRVNLRSTILMTPDGQEVIIPNKDVIQNPLINYSHTPRRRVDLTCGVAYGDDLEKVKSVVLKTMKDTFELPPDKPLEFYYTEFGDSSINFVVRLWQNIIAQSEYYIVQDRAIMAIKKAFKREGITIPFPIRTLDFGVVGGARLDDLYPKKMLSSGNEKDRD